MAGDPSSIIQPNCSDIKLSEMMTTVCKKTITKKTTIVKKGGRTVKVDEVTQEAQSQEEIYMQIVI